jgi:hydroxyacylglutathione hydrolase
MEPRPTSDNQLEVHTIRTREDNWAYVLKNRDSSSGLLIDCPEAQPIQAWLKPRAVAIRGIFITHHHHDHVAALAEFPGVPVYCSRTDQHRIGADDRAVAMTESNQNTIADVIELNARIRVVPIPGHTRGQIGLFVQSQDDREAHFFTGDTVFQFGCGRIFEGTHEELFESLQTIKKLPSETLLHFGHDYFWNNFDFLKALRGKTDLKADSQLVVQHLDWCKIDALCRARKAADRDTPMTVADEHRVNPFLAAGSLEVFKELRALRDEW